MLVIVDFCDAKNSAHDHGLYTTFSVLIEVLERVIECRW
jgi:hypothetical protein